MKCMECGKEMLRSLDPIQSVFKGETMEVKGVEHWKCASCGEVEFESKDLDALDKAENQIYRELHGLLSPQEIRSLRSSYGLKQNQFEQMLGVASPTASRWETGAVIQSKTADNLMRLMREFPQAASLLIANAGFEMPKMDINDSFSKNEEPSFCVRWNIPASSWASFVSESRFHKSATANMNFPHTKQKYEHIKPGSLIEAA
ncbi:type II toxin-antitoxin system MqsA family antitoxin [Adlercreutzia sp. ZJ304]|uniref:type II toxin-antitoxin system MqsA family antitoxin n=1 Tax=Adlercreutzia sp. ZJ304 TaxID=2709791 RepID=UPI0013EC07CE|nr:type II toxin-antitoxin system MqsA family antitoxin [Adlercreutzia sp. ZJ304]